MAERHRLLVALMLEGRTATEVDGIRRALGSSQLGRIAPHVTLVPPVNVAGDAIGDAERVVREAAGGVTSIDVELGPPATFEENRSVFYLAVSKSRQLESLRAALFTGPFAGRETGARPFVPHVTLDSGPSRHVDERLLRDFSGYVTSIRFDEVSLLEHRDDTSGRAWETITSYELDRPSISGTGGLEVSFARGHRPSPSLRALAASWAAPLPPSIETERFAAASIAGEVVGIATWYETSDAAIVRSHVVAPVSRGFGVGTRLLSYVEQFERARGRSELVVDAELAASAIAYYQGRGYRRKERARESPRRSPLVRWLGAPPEQAR